MSEQKTVLLVSDSEPVLSGIRFALEHDQGVQLRIARNAADGLTSAASAPPDAIVVGLESDPVDSAAWTESVRQEPACARVPVVCVCEAGTHAFAATDAGADDLLMWPAAAGEIASRIHAALRLGVLDAEREAFHVELERLRESGRQRFEQVLELLVHLVDLGVPGATDRSIRTTEMAMKLARRFGVPERLLRDLELAARLHELGRAIGSGAAPHSPPSSAEWHYTQNSAAILGEVEGLEGAAELVRNLYENWDGTGVPDHWEMGQIPLRCRILRVSIDYLSALEARSSSGAEPGLTALEERSGTRYDPMVVVHLRALLTDVPEGGWRGSKLLVPIPELREGMVLAEDLYTMSGLKLLARETRLTPATLEIILKRHRIEPMLQGAAVHRRSA